MAQHYIRFKTMALMGTAPVRLEMIDLILLLAQVCQQRAISHAVQTHDYGKCTSVAVTCLNFPEARSSAQQFIKVFANAGRARSCLASTCVAARRRS